MSSRDLQSVYGAEANPTGDPIGGGAGYRRVVRRGDVTVANAGALLAALEAARAGQVVYVASGSETDLVGHVGIAVPAGVTLAGDRGVDGSPGPLLQNRKMPDRAFLLSAGEGARITGLRIKGSDPDFPDIDYDVKPRSWCGVIRTAGANVEVDNCELSNVHHSGVSASHPNTHVHHCFIHDVHAYPVCVGGMAQPTLIEANLIYWIWHTVAGTGQPGTGYEARYNIAVRQKPPKSWGERHRTHGWDMHEFRSAFLATPRRLLAGDRILIHHNTMQNTGPARSGLIRGVPRDLAQVYNNWFSESDPGLGVRQVEPKGNVWVYNNVYGPEMKQVPIGEDTTARILLKRPEPTGEPARVSGKLALDFEVSVLEGLQVKRVTARVDDRELYAGERAPGPDEVVLDTRELANGIHELFIAVEDNRGVTGAQAVTLAVEN
ncbi:MAG: right-handed parallel beta-helix repeat-containing protein [Armatimonadetes bacterium]|nr:right-handed parallel beta-helix repeat-containing protein [Armatimonadota bacterium]